MSISFKIVARNMSCSDISIFLKKPFLTIGLDVLVQT